MNRGGSWNNNSRNCTAGNRNSYNPDNRNNNLGFRLAAFQHCDFKTGSQSPAHSCSAVPTKDGHAIPVSRASRTLGWARAVLMGAATLEGPWKPVEGATAAEKAAMRFFKDPWRRAR